MNYTFTTTTEVQATTLSAARAKLACHLRRVADISTFVRIWGDSNPRDFLVTSSTITLARSWVGNHGLTLEFGESGREFQATLTAILEVSGEIPDETSQNMAQLLNKLADQIENGHELGQQGGGGEGVVNLFWELTGPLTESKEIDSDIQRILLPGPVQEVDAEELDLSIDEEATTRVDLARQQTQAERLYPGEAVEIAEFTRDGLPTPPPVSEKLGAATFDDLYRMVGGPVSALVRPSILVPNGPTESGGPSV